jgi:hypothetical protein
MSELTNLEDEVESDVALGGTAECLTVAVLLKFAS